MYLAPGMRGDLVVREDQHGIKVHAGCPGRLFV